MGICGCLVSFMDYGTFLCSLIHNSGILNVRDVDSLKSSSGGDLLFGCFKMKMRDICILIQFIFIHLFIIYIPQLPKKVREENLKELFLQTGQMKRWICSYSDLNIC